MHQLLAASVWTSLFALPLIRQHTLIIAGTDDPILPHASLHLHPGGHVDLIANAAELAPVIESFRDRD